MVDGIRTIYPSGLNEGFGSKVHVGSRVRHETPEEGRRTHRPKHFEYNRTDGNCSLNRLNDKKDIRKSVIIFQCDKHGGLTRGKDPKECQCANPHGLQ